MARYIDADGLKKRCTTVIEYCGHGAPESWAEAYQEFIELIDAERSVDTVRALRCSKCKWERSYDETYYCPRCGARLEEIDGDTT